jgi:hypothetical protein
LLRLAYRAASPIAIKAFNLFNFSQALKSSENKKDLNDVTAAPFLVCFFAAGGEKKTPKTGQL